uniref:Uncharacterized protein n=1 Tax=Neolamprologus brichardi TaxID=32507 RepID=A0A3Q4GC63_NEOBR
MGSGRIDVFSFSVNGLLNQIKSSKILRKMRKEKAHILETLPASRAARDSQNLQKMLHFCDLYHYRDNRILISGYEILVISHSPTEKCSWCQFSSVGEQTSRWHLARK